MDTTPDAVTAPSAQSAGSAFHGRRPGSGLASTQASAPSQSANAQLRVQMPVNLTTPRLENLSIYSGNTQSAASRNAVAERAASLRSCWDWVMNGASRILDNMLCRGFAAAEASAGRRGRRPLRRRGGFHIRPGTFPLPHTATGEHRSPLQLLSYFTPCPRFFQPFSTGFTRLTQISPAAAQIPASQCRAARGRACAPI